MIPPSDYIDGRESYDILDEECKRLGLNKSEWWVLLQTYYSKDNFTSQNCWIDIEVSKEKPEYRDTENPLGLGLDSKHHNLEHFMKPYWME